MAAKEPDLKYFKALTDVFLLSIREQNRTISETISNFLYDEFKKEREKSISKPVEYPWDYYFLIYRTIEELAILKNKKNHAVEYRAAGGVWLLGELPGYEISETTYTWLWRNILLALQYDKDDMIIAYWRHAHQYITYCLGHIQPEFDRGVFDKPKNKDIIEKREKERKRFLEFHYALGGLLLYKGKYKCIQRMFNYTTSEPPRYELLPERMNEIFSRYIEFRDPYDRTFSWISNKYSFPDQDGLNSDGVIKKWISSYIALLFLRQYTIVPYLVIMRPLDFPTPPPTQGEKEAWIDNMGYLKQTLTECIENSELINQLNFNFLTRQWCQTHAIRYPLDFVDEYTGLLQQAYNDGAINLALSEEKIAKFHTTTKDIIESVLDSFVKINNPLPTSEDTNSRFINGLRTVIRKDAFAEISEVDNMDYDSFLAQVIAENISDGVLSTFFLGKTKSYLLKREDIFKAIEKLGIDKNYVLISFGMDINSYIDKVNELSINSFKDIPIYSYSRSRMGQSLFIIKKSDLPQIVSNEISTDEINKYSLAPISTKYNLYASVLDLNQASQEIRTENSQNITEDELRKSVLLIIAQSIEIRWKKNIKLIQLIEYSEYRQQGLANNLSDIE